MGEGKTRIGFDLQSLYEGSWKVALSDVVTSISFEARAKLYDFCEKIKDSLVARIIFKSFWIDAILPIEQTVHIAHINHMIDWAGCHVPGKRAKRHGNIGSPLNPTLHKLHSIIWNSVFMLIVTAHSPSELRVRGLSFDGM